MKFTGYFTAPSTGTVSFGTYSDDASFAFIGTAGQNVSTLVSNLAAANSTNYTMIVSNGGGHGLLSVTGSYSVVAGQVYPVMLYFSQGGGGWGMNFAYTMSGTASPSTTGSSLTSAFSTAGQTFSGPVTFNSSSGGVTAATGPMNFNGAITINSGKQVQFGNGTTPINLNIASTITDGGLINFNLSSGSSTTIAGVISDGAASGALTVTSGSLSLTGANTYSGNTIIGSGATLTVGGSGSLGYSSTSGISNYAGTIANAGSLYYSSTADQILSGIISGVGSLTKDTGTISTLTLGAANTYSGATTITAGYVAQGVANALSSSSDVTINTNGTLNLSGYSATIGSLTGTGNITNSRNFSQNNLILYFDPSNVQSYPGTGSTLYNLVNSSSAGSGNNATFVGTTSGGITYDAVNKVLNLNNTCTANCTSANSNYLTLGSAGLSSFANGLTFISQANMGSGTSAWARIFDWGNGAGLNNILFSRNGTTNTLHFDTGNVTYEATGAILNSQIANYAVTLTSSGVGQLFVNGSTVTSSVTSGAAATGLPTSVTRTLDYLGHSNWTADGSLTGSLGVLLLYSNSQTPGQVLAANTEINRTVSAATLTYGTSANGTYSGKILDGNAAISLVKQGTGISTLSGTNAYTGGTTINAGTLQISSDSNLGTVPTSPATNITINNGATLLVSGQNSAVTLSANRSIVLGTGNENIQNNNTSNGLTIAGAVSGSGALILGSSTNTGTIYLTNASNSYQGGTAINGGTLSIAADGDLGNTSGGITFGGGNLTLTGSTAFSSARSLSINATTAIANNNSGGATFSGQMTGSGALTITNALNTAVSGYFSSTATTTIASNTTLLNYLTSGIVSYIGGAAIYSGASTQASSAYILSYTAGATPTAVVEFQSWDGTYTKYVNAQLTQSGTGATASVLLKMQNAGYVAGNVLGQSLGSTTPNWTTQTLNTTSITSNGYGLGSIANFTSTTLSAASGSTYSGNVTINAGTLRVGAVGGLASAKVYVTGSGTTFGTLDLGGTTVSNNLYLNLYSVFEIIVE